eukprot:scaffold34378_cov129-Isochrysis_galbana.AAC.2
MPMQPHYALYAPNPTPNAILCCLAAAGSTDAAPGPGGRGPRFSSRAAPARRLADELVDGFRNGARFLQHQVGLVGRRAPLPPVGACDRIHPAGAVAAPTPPKPLHSLHSPHGDERGDRIPREAALARPAREAGEGQTARAAGGSAAG